MPVTWCLKYLKIAHKQDKWDNIRLIDFEEICIQSRENIKINLSENEARVLTFERPPVKWIKCLVFGDLNLSDLFCIKCVVFFSPFVKGLIIPYSIRTCFFNVPKSGIKKIWKSEIPFFVTSNLYGIVINDHIWVIISYQNTILPLCGPIVSKFASFCIFLKIIPKIFLYRISFDLN